MGNRFSFDDKNSRILVVDDMGMSRATARKLLEELGFHRISEAIHGDEAWMHLSAADAEGDPYVLVVTDWMMPVLDGLGLLSRINASGWSALPAVLLATAESDASQVAQAVKAGIAAYIKKPLTQDELHQALKRIREDADRG